MNKKNGEKPGFMKAYEKDKAREAADAKLFNIDQVLEDSSKIKEVYIEKINMKVKYGALTMADVAEVSAAKTDEEKTAVLLWKMLSKADKNVTLEKVRKLPAEIATALIVELAGFLAQ